MDPNDYCTHCGCWLDHAQGPDHASNCPAYDGPPPEPESLGAIREQLNAIADALIYLCERADPMAIADDRRRERWPVLEGLRNTKTR